MQCLPQAGLGQLVEAESEVGGADALMGPEHGVGATDILARIWTFERRIGEGVTQLYPGARALGESGCLPAR